jgi:hypothetical protein
MKSVATMNTQPMGSPRTTTERNAPMNGAKAMHYHSKVKPYISSIIAK